MGQAAEEIRGVLTREDGGSPIRKKGVVVRNELQNRPDNGSWYEERGGATGLGYAFTKVATTVVPAVVEAITTVGSAAVEAITTVGSATVKATTIAGAVSASALNITLVVFQNETGFDQNNTRFGVQGVIHGSDTSPDDDSLNIPVRILIPSAAVISVGSCFFGYALKTCGKRAIKFLLGPSSAVETVDGDRGEVELV